MNEPEEEQVKIERQNLTHYPIRLRKCHAFTLSARFNRFSFLEQHAMDSPGSSLLYNERNIIISNDFERVCVTGSQFLLVSWIHVSRTGGMTLLLTLKSVVISAPILLAGHQRCVVLPRVLSRERLSGSTDQEQRSIISALMKRNETLYFPNTWPLTLHPTTNSGSLVVAELIYSRTEIGTGNKRRHSDRKNDVTRRKGKLFPRPLPQFV